MNRAPAGVSVFPLPGLFCAVILPLWLNTISREMESPSPEFFPRVRIANVHFDHGDRGSGQHRDGVSKCVRVVGEGSRVKNDFRARIKRFVNPADEFRLIVRLSNGNSLCRRRRGFE